VVALRPDQESKKQTKVQETNMSVYRMEDGTVINTDKAKQSWEEATRFNGSNMISVATGSQWHHQTLYESRKGRFYIEHTSQWQGSVDRCEWVSEQEAVRWLLANEEEVPDRLAHIVEQVEE
jgi:hypothetical protein